MVNCNVTVHTRSQCKQHDTTMSMAFLQRTVSIINSQVPSIDYLVLMSTRWYHWQLLYPLHQARHKRFLARCQTQWGLYALRHGIQISMEVCHPARSTEWLDCHPKSCELWRIRTGPIKKFCSYQLSLWVDSAYASGSSFHSHLRRFERLQKHDCREAQSLPSHCACSLESRS